MTDNQYELLMKLNKLNCPNCNRPPMILKDWSEKASHNVVRIVCGGCGIDSGQWGRIDKAIKEWEKLLDVEQEDEQ